MFRARTGRFAVALALTLACVGAAACTTFSSAPTPDDAASPIVVRDAQVPALMDAAVDAFVAAQDGSKDARVDAATKHYVVFVTSETIEAKFAGSLGPTTLADVFCQEKGNTIGGGSKWKAWLMADGGAPQQRLVEPPGGWFDMKDKLVAAKLIDLTVAMLANPPSFDETGKQASGEVWTGVPGPRCSDWTGSGQCDVGTVGHTERWSNASSDRFWSNKQRLYCFEQPP